MTMHNLAEINHGYPPMIPIPPPPSATLDGSSIRRSPAEEEMDDNEEGTDWAIRVGNAPPPNWAKRKPNDEEGNEDRNKRARLEQ